MRPGDVVWIPSGLRHRHGVAATTSVTHLALQEEMDGQAVTWMEKVSGAQYGR
jgi:quercetin dioxygenase-like cupin family protein